MRRDPTLFGILLLALALRLAYAVQASSTPLAEVLLLDSEFYDRQARSLLAGSGWTEGVFFMNSPYPYLYRDPLVERLHRLSRGGGQ